MKGKSKLAWEELVDMIFGQETNNNDSGGDYNAFWGIKIREPLLNFVEQLTTKIAKLTLLKLEIGKTNTRNILMRVTESHGQPHKKRP